mmetsp:Transcript_11035/g.27897  ORF Transcript_11035/g.27897 Transcript_11035/m.27897 type:complete len:248 (+) Transcript_11035:400-1143(+)
MSTDLITMGTRRRRCERLLACPRRVAGTTTAAVTAVVATEKVERNGRPGRLQHILHLVHLTPHKARELLRGKVELAFAVLLLKLGHFLKGVGDVHRQPHVPAVIADAADQGLLDPPCRIRAELEIPRQVEFLDSGEQPLDPFLHQVPESNALPTVPVRQVHNQANIVVQHEPAGLRGLHVPLPQLGRRQRRLLRAPGAVLRVQGEGELLVRGQAIVNLLEFLNCALNLEAELGLLDHAGLLLAAQKV